jgi:tRNA(Ile)-lysidine synthase
VGLPRRRAETLLLNLLRGAGPDGLVALARERPLRAPAPAPPPGPPSPAVLAVSPRGARGTARAPDAVAARQAAAPEQVPGGGATTRLVRPLLDCSREETGAFLATVGLPHWHDSTNDSNDHRRNRVRNELMPSLRAHFNPKLDAALARFLDVLSPERELLESLTEDAYARARMSRAQEEEEGGGAVAAAAGAPPGAAALRVEALHALPLALQRRVVHCWLGDEVAAAAEPGGALGGEAGPGGAEGGGTAGRYSQERARRVSSGASQV